MISLQVTQHPYTAMVKLTAFKKAYLQLCFVRFCVSVFILEYSSGVFDLIGSFHENLKQRLLGPSSSTVTSFQFQMLIKQKQRRSTKADTRRSRNLPVSERSHVPNDNLT